MENKKKELAKAAIAALLLASSLPAATHADENIVQGTLLAGNCGGSKAGCGASAGCGGSPANQPSSYSTSNPYNRPSNYSTTTTYDTPSQYSSSPQSYQSYPMSSNSSGSQQPYGNNPNVMSNRPGNPYDEFDPGMSKSPNSPRPNTNNPNNWNR